MNRIISMLRKCVSPNVSGAQGTTEYLVIIAIVVVISLVVTGLVINSSGNSISSVSSSSNKLSGWTSALAVTETAVSPDGNFLVELMNNTGEFITVSNVRVNDVNVFFSEDLAGSASKGFIIPSNSACSSGSKVSANLVITYATVNGLFKTETFPAKVGFDCTPYTANLNFMANTCITQATTIEPNLLPQNIWGKVSLFGVRGILGLHSGATKCADWNSWTTNTWASSCSNSGIPPNQDAALDSDRNMFANRFATRVLQSDGNYTVEDTWGKLMWWDGHSPGTMDWNSAETYCNNFNTGGYSNWRLATFSEAFSIFDIGAAYNGGSYACVKQFNDCFGNWVWTSSSLPWAPYLAYLYLPYNGFINYGYKSNVDYARCVRSES